MNDNEESKAALKSTGIVGGGQIINLAISLIKTKIVALILGPSGVGVVGLLTTATEMIKNIATIGIPFSGVRDISIASSSEKNDDLNNAISVFLNWMFYLSICGALITIALCIPLSKLMFGNEKYATSIGILAISVFFTSLSSGYISVMQGKRSVVMMAKSGILSSFLSAIIAVLIYFFLKEDGIIPVLVISSVINCVVTYYFYKKLLVVKLDSISLKKSWPQAKMMIRIGFFTIIVSVFDQIMSLGLRSYISDKAGVDGVGLFTAATTVASTYLAIILSSLGSDYYPKLASHNNDNLALSKSVNTQLQIILLLATPFIVGMVCFGDIALKALYSKEFLRAVEILRWQILGDFFKIIAWPCGYVFLAKGLGRLYIAYSITYTLIYVGLIYLGWDFFGFFSIGLSFFISQFIGLIFTYIYSYVNFGIKISKSNQKIILITGIILIMAYVSQFIVRDAFKYIASVLITLVIIIFSISKLALIIDLKKVVTQIIKKIKK